MYFKKTKKSSKNKIINISMLMLLILSIASFSVLGSEYLINEDNLEEGISHNLTWDNDKYILETGYYNGDYESIVIDLDQHSNINTLNVLTEDYDDFANNGGDDGNVDMTNSIFLYHFDQTSGVVVDSSGNDNNGYIMNSASREGEGIHSTNGLLGDDNGYVQIPHTESLNLHTTGTLAFAFYNTPNTDSSTIISKQDSVNNTGYRIYIFGDRIYINFNDGGSVDSSDDVIDEDYKWYFIVMVWDGDAIEYFINGVSEGIDTTVNYTANTVDLIIGARNGESYPLNDGVVLDELTMWSDVKNYGEVYAITKQMATDKRVYIKSCESILCDEDYIALNETSIYDISIEENRYFRVKVEMDRLNLDFENELTEINLNYDVTATTPFEVSKSQEHRIIGTDTYGTYNNGAIGMWNSQTDTGLEVKSRFINNVENVASPKVAYLDDGKKYIISWNDGYISLYKFDEDTEDLEIIDGFSISGGSLAGDFIVHKMNNINYIVIPLQSGGSGDSYAQTIGFLSYDGEFHYETLSVGSAYGRYFGGEPNKVAHATMLNCNGDRCVVAFPVKYNIPYQDNYARMRATLISRTEVLDSYTWVYDFHHTAGEGACVYSPVGSNLIYGSVDNDFYNGDEYDYDDAVFTWNGVKEYGDLRVYIMSLNINSTDDGISLDWVTSRDIGGGLGHGCNDHPLLHGHPSAFTTGITAVDYDGQAGNGKELFVGALVDGSWTNYRILMWDAQGAYKQSIPDSNDIEGVLLSNPLVLKCFDDSKGTDIGAIGYKESNQKLVFVCNCGVCGHDNDDCEFEDYEEPVGFNVTDLTNVGRSIYVIEADGDTSTSELVTPFGVFDIPKFTAGDWVCHDNELTKIYNSQSRDSIIVPIDYQNNGRADFLYSSATAIGYLDDGFSNKKPYVNSLDINPCAGLATLRLGTDILITATSHDDEGDSVSYRVKLYANTENEIDSGWSEFMTPSTEFRYSNVLDYNVNIGYIEIYVKDASHTEFNMVERLFSVNNNSDSKTFGECITSLTLDDLLEGQDTGDLLPTTSEDYIDEYGNKVNDNALKNGMDELGGFVGIGGFLMYIIIMFGVALGMFFYTDMGAGHGSSKFGAIAIVEVLMIIIGAVLKIIPVSIIIILVLALVVIIAFWARNYFTGSRQTGFE